MFVSSQGYIMPSRAFCNALLAIALGLVGPMSPTCRAQGFIEHLEPPVIERGKTTRVAAVGSSFGKPLDLWTALPPGAVKAVPVADSTPARAVFDVTVAADAPVGISGLRVATVDGLSNAHLFLIDDLPVRPAPAPGAAPAKVALPVALWGRFREAEVDRFAIEVSAGQRVSFEAVGNRLGREIDPLVTIRDAKGRFVAERDNDPGLYFDFRFEHLFTAAGTYIVEVRDARFHGDEHGYYVLRMGRFPAARVAVPAAVRRGQRAELRLPELADVALGLDVPAAPAPGMIFGALRRPGDEGSAWLPLETTDAEVTVHREPGNTVEQGSPAKVPGMLCGVLRKPGERQFFRLDLTKGQKIQVRAEARALNSPADLEIAITDAAGKELRRVGENAQEEVVLDYSAGNPGVYGLSVRDANRDGGPAFAYRLEVRSGQPQVQVVAEVEGLPVPRGGYQIVPLTATRIDCNGPIALSLAGAPAGVTLTPSEIGDGVNAIVCKIAAAPDAELGVHTLQILARPTAVPDAPPTLVRTRPMIDRQRVNVDLIPYGLREDQRRLPPALTDRFAVQVTPPAPFTVELPAPLVTLARYQHADIPIVTTRVPGFSGPITFSATGGQIAPKDEGRTRVYTEFPPATADRLQVTGSIHSRILTNLTKHRVEVTAVGVHQGRRVVLTRAFDLDIRSAFTVAAEPAMLKLEPGATAKVRLTADRMKSFDGDVTVQLSPSLGLNLPEQVVIPRGQAAVDVEVKVAPDRTPGRQSINLQSTGTVSGFEEELRGGRFEVEVVKPMPPKK
jgi:hypothetical protein